MTARWTAWLVLVGCASAGSPSSPGVDAATDGKAADAPGMSDAPPSACDLKLAGHATGFETGVGGWTHAVLDGAVAAGWPLDEWQNGTASSGPGSCHTGTKCWATRLDANYTSCERAALVSPIIDLSACAGRTVNLTFWSWTDFWTGTVAGKTGTWFDGGLLEVSTNGTAWMAVTPTPAYPGTLKINPDISGNSCVSANNFYVNNKPGWVGTSGGWQKISVPIPAAAVTPSFRFRLAFSSGVSFASSDAETNRLHTRPGWYVDDVAFSAQ